MASALAGADPLAAPREGTTAADPAALLFSHVVQSRLERLFARGDRVIELGCGTGEDAVFLASRGVRVVGIDPAPAAVERARALASERGLGPAQCRFEVLALDNAALAGSGFDGAYSALGALDGGRLRATGNALAAMLRPGARVLVSLPGPWPLPAVTRRVLTGVGEARRPWSSRVTGVAAAPGCPTAAEARRALGPSLEWTGSSALGVVLPAPGQAGWAADHPQTFGLLAALEGILRHWPGLRTLGDHVVLEGRVERSAGAMLPR